MTSNLKLLLIVFIGLTIDYSNPIIPITAAILLVAIPTKD
jgi:hypothetical protein